MLEDLAGDPHSLYHVTRIEGLDILGCTGADIVACYRFWRSASFF